MFSRKVFSGLVLYALFGVGLAVSSASAASETPSLSGQKDFLEYCAPCHGSSGVGDGPVALELATKPANLTLIEKQHGSFDRNWLKAYIDGRSMPRAHGNSQMPVWGRWFALQATAGGLLQEEQREIEKQVNKRLDDLMAYLKSIQVK